MFSSRHVIGRVLHFEPISTRDGIRFRVWLYKGRCVKFLSSFSRLSVSSAIFFLCSRNIWQALVAHSSRDLCLQCLTRFFSRCTPLPWLFFLVSQNYVLWPRRFRYLQLAPTWLPPFPYAPNWTRLRMNARSPAWCYSGGISRRIFVP